MKNVYHPSHIVKVTKLPLTLLITVSALFGLAFANEKATVSHYEILALGTALVVAAGAMFNNAQDADIDSVMSRTKSRPIPLGIYSQHFVRAASFVSGLAGLAVLSNLPNGLWVAATALGGIALYNAIYTPLKRKTMLAIIPGALCGAIPPIMGWLAGNGSLSSVSFVALVLVLLVWQLPHFWLILLFRHHDYTAASIPNFLDKFGQPSLKRILFAWLLAFSILLCVVSLGGTIQFATTRIFIVANAAAIACSASYLLFAYKKNPPWRSLFIHLNATLGVSMLAIIVEKWFAS